MVKVKGQGQISQFCPILSNFVFKTSSVPSNTHQNKSNGIRWFNTAILGRNICHQTNVWHAQYKKSRSNNSILPNFAKFCIRNYFGSY